MNADHIVFLAEDDLDDEEMLVEMMKEYHPRMEFHTANTGSKAMEILKNLQKTPSLIILDYNLPEISGAEILGKLIELNKFKDVIKVVWSTSNSPVYQKKCMDLGAYSYIVKPTGVAGIRSIAKQLIDLCTKPA